jgi:hypothetical protein
LSFCALLAELEAPLVERIDAPDPALDEHLVPKEWMAASVSLSELKGGNGEY